MAGHRKDIETDLAPGDEPVRAYRRARIEAAKETGLDENTLPATCPYALDDIASRSFSR